MLFADTKENETLLKQLKLFKTDTKGLDNRDLKISVKIFNKENETIFRSRKVSKNDFKFILIGKDGNEKLNTNKLVSLNELYNIIDAMPMRQSEMRNR